MIKELFDLGYLNVEKMIISESKNLGLSSLEAIVLIEIINCYKKTRKIDKSFLIVNLKESSNTIDDILNSLLEKNLYEIYLSYEGAKAEEYISLDTLFKKLEETTVAPQAVKIESETGEVINLIQTKMNKLLSANELDYVKDWVFSLGYNKQRIQDVIINIENANKKVTFRNLMVAISNNGDIVGNNASMSNILSKLKH